MSDLRYEAPATLAAAVALLAGAKGTARVLAGGTDVIVQMQSDGPAPDLLVDIKRIPELHRIDATAGGFRVGAAVTCMELIEHASFAQAWPGVVDAVRLIGSIQVKGRATLAGNLCNASPAADSVPALIAAGARVAITGPVGMREAPVEAVPSGPGTTSLAPSEIVTSILFPPRPPRSGGAYRRFTPRTEMDIAVVGVGIDIALDHDGLCSAARVALGAVAPTALLVTEAADALIGTRLDAATLDRLAQVTRAACRPIDDKRGTREFRVEIAGVLAKRRRDSLRDSPSANAPRPVLARNSVHTNYSGGCCRDLPLTDVG